MAKGAVEPDSENEKSKGMYKTILANVFNKKFDPNAPAEVVEFSRADLDIAAEEIGEDPKNFPDLSYYMRSRAKELPEDVRKHGFVTMISVGNARPQCACVWLPFGYPP